MVVLGWLLAYLWGGVACWLRVLELGDCGMVWLAGCGLGPAVLCDGVGWYEVLPKPDKN